MALNDDSNLTRYEVEVRAGGSLGTMHYTISAKNPSEARRKAKAKAPKLAAIGTVKKIG
jgi:hypothetical protein